MSVKAKIIIDDVELNVLWFSFAYTKRVDINGRPTTKGVFHGLDFAIETQKTVNFAHWAFSPTLTKNIELHIYPVIMGGRTRIIKYYDCHLLKWDNHFSANGTAPMHETLHISAGGVKDNNSAVEYSAYWRKTYDNDDVEPTVIDNQEEPEVNRYYITDTDDNELDNYDTGDKIVLHIETKNRVGDNFKISLNDKTHDFKYKGKVLENDVLKLIISSDHEKIELEVINQSQQE